MLFLPSAQRLAVGLRVIEPIAVDIAAMRFDM